MVWLLPYETKAESTRVQAYSDKVLSPMQETAFPASPRVSNNFITLQSSRVPQSGMWRVSQGCAAAAPVSGPLAKV